jgi:hypothetical protein
MNSNDLDRQILAAVKKYMDRSESLTSEGIAMELPSIDEDTIEASLKALSQACAFASPFGLGGRYRDITSREKTAHP